MIMPKKHISLSESFIGLGAFVLQTLSSPLTIDSCWEEIYSSYIKTGIISKKHSFDNFVLTLDLLYALNAININERGEIYNVSKET
ncbi:MULTISPECIES: ABC-three component system middle component 6 [Lachnospiraceae]|jgi:hypothetical protein|uniref:Uncharacterized protein n=1 Tax=Enterocloster bolteae 90B8 TaxID=997897 RepID=N9ZZB5_9FIRM|nr:ABC-three component system middle component 6 [Enterocloster bolteae]ENZ45280.1 hypothetical protein HMPREF1097_00114 [Enterocloster bolteae 90B8]MBS6094198.1 hypothetical protein [Enterocloster bolteae]